MSATCQVLLRCELSKGHFVAYGRNNTRGKFASPTALVCPRRSECVRFGNQLQLWSLRHLVPSAGNRVNSFCLKASSEDNFSVPNELKETIALDQLIDSFLAAKDQQELTQLVAENILSCNQKFWMRLATRSDTASTQEEKQKLGCLAQTVMWLVDAMVKKTEGQLQDSAGVLQDILRAAADSNGEWSLPLTDDKLEAMRKAVTQHAARLDEALLSNAFAWMRKASEDRLDNMVVLLQKVLQLYAGRQLALGAPADAAEQLLNEVLVADEANWDAIISAASQQGRCSEPAFMEAVQRRMEGTVLTLPSGSYAQRVQAEYLKELEQRAKGVFRQLASS